jgi:hypothetical protein
MFLQPINFFILEFLFYFVHPFLYLPFFKHAERMLFDTLLSKRFWKISLLCFYKNVLQPINYFILEFLFYFVHPFFYLLFFKNRRQFKNIGMNLTTRDFDTWQQEILRPYHPMVLRPMNQRFCDPIIQWFCDPIIQWFCDPIIQWFCDPWTKGFATHEPKVLRPMNQRFCDPIIQRFLIKGGLRPLHAKMYVIIDIQKWVGHWIIG